MCREECSSRSLRNTLGSCQKLLRCVCRRSLLSGLQHQNCLNIQWYPILLGRISHCWWRVQLKTVNFFRQSSYRPISNPLRSVYQIPNTKIPLKNLKMISETSNLIALTIVRFSGITTSELGKIFSVRNQEPTPINESIIAMSTPLQWTIQLQIKTTSTQVLEI